MTSTLAAVQMTAPSIKVDDAALPDDFAMALLSMRINRGLSITGRATLRFADVGYQLASSATMQLGSTVKVSANTTSGSVDIFSGLITAAAVEQSATQAPEYVITADDASFRLGLAQRIRTLEQMTATDVISTIASENKLTADTTGASSPTNEYLLQQGSDLAFLDSLTRRNNWVWWVDDKSLCVRPAAGSGSPVKTLDVGQDLLDFSVRASGLRPTKITVNGWDLKQKQDIVGSAGTPGATAKTNFATAFTSPEEKLGASSMAVGDSNPNTEGEATTLADSLTTTLAAEAVVARATCEIAPEIKPYTWIKINNAGPASGSFQVSEVEHSYSHRGFFTKFVAGPLRQSVLADSFSATTPDPGFVNFGLASAVVSEVGTEAAQVGMVKVKFNGGDGKVVSAWARVLSIGGGDKRGAVFMPEIGDEVLIGFERGDTRHPVVMGGLFGGTAAVAADANVFSGGKVTYRRITSRVGNVIELSDGESDDKKHVKLAAVSDAQQLRIGADRGDIKFPDGKPFAITVGSSKIEFDGQGNITIKGMKITIQADSDIDLQAKANLTAKGQAKIALQGAQAELKGDSQVTVQGGLQAALKAAIVKIN